MQDSEFLVRGVNLSYLALPVSVLIGLPQSNEWVTRFHVYAFGGLAPKLLTTCSVDAGSGGGIFSTGRETFPCQGFSEFTPRRFNLDLRYGLGFTIGQGGFVQFNEFVLSQAAFSLHRTSGATDAIEWRTRTPFARFAFMVSPAWSRRK
jgi:hypothetical protein